MTWQEEWNAYFAEAPKNIYFSDDEQKFMDHHDDGDDGESNKNEDEDIFRVPAQICVSVKELEKPESEEETESEEGRERSIWWIPDPSKQRALAEAFSTL